MDSWPQVRDPQLRRSSTCAAGDAVDEALGEGDGVEEFDQRAGLVLEGAGGHPWRHQGKGRGQKRARAVRGGDAWQRSRGTTYAGPILQNPWETIDVIKKSGGG